MLMIKIIKYLVFAISICLMFVACTNNGKGSESFGKGKRMILSFDTNPSTGYDWDFTVSDGDEYANVILERTETVDNNEPGLLGAPIKRNYYFVATKAGKQNLHFIYRRPWIGGDEAYDVIYEINVDDDLNISCLSKVKGTIESSKELTFFPNPVFE